MGVELPLRVVVTILECCVTFSGVKMSIRSFVLLLLLGVGCWVLDGILKQIHFISAYELTFHQEDRK